MDHKPSKSGRKKKNEHTTVSQICGMGTDPVWDDTELVKQFDEVLREWKQEKNFYITEDGDSEAGEVPAIGPWVTVEDNPCFEGIDVPPIPFLDDDEMISLFNEALSSWKAERRPSVVRVSTNPTGV